MYLNDNSMDHRKRVSLVINWSLMPCWQPFGDDHGHVDRMMMVVRCDDRAGDDDDDDDDDDDCLLYTSPSPRDS